MEYNILDYGAIPDGKTLNTSRIQMAIDEASEYNDSTVIIPEGTFLSGAIYLKKGFEKEYEWRHRNIWTEVKAKIEASGVYDYSIFIDETT